MTNIVPPQQKTIHWRDRSIAKSEAISDAWEVVKAYAARAAEWILFGCLFANILEMFPLPFPGWFGNTVLAVQAVTLDVAGFGLATMADHARRQGNERAANTARRMGWTLISLMILTVGLVTLPVLISSTREFVTGAEKALLLARVIITVLYGHVVHSLRQAHLEFTNQVSTLQQEVSTLQHTVSTLQPHLDTLSGQLREKAQELDSLRVQLNAEQHKVSTLERELQNNQAWQESRDQHLLAAEEQRVSMLQQELDAELVQTATLRRQLSANQRELEEMQAAVERGRQEVSALRQQLRMEQQRVSSFAKAADGGQSARMSSGRAKVNTGHLYTVDSGQERVIQLDMKQRKSGQDAAGQIKALITAEPGLSDRAIANKLACSPTTVGRWRKIIEQERTECVNE